MKMRPVHTNPHQYSSHTHTHTHTDTDTQRHTFTLSDSLTSPLSPYKWTHTYTSNLRDKCTHISILSTAFDSSFHLLADLTKHFGDKSLSFEFELEKGTHGTYGCFNVLAKLSLNSRHFIFCLPSQWYDISICFNLPFIIYYQCLLWCSPSGG